MVRFHKALPNVKRAYVTLQDFTPDLQKIYTDISAISVTLCNSVATGSPIQLHIWAARVWCIRKTPRVPFAGFKHRQGMFHVLWYLCVDTNILKNCSQVGRQMMTGLSTLASKLPKAWRHTASFGCDVSYVKLVRLVCTSFSSGTITNQTQRACWQISWFCLWKAH